jgi:hypothetical protein
LALALVTCGITVTSFGLVICNLNAEVGFTVMDEGSCNAQGGKVTQYYNCVRKMDNHFVVIGNVDTVDKCISNGGTPLNQVQFFKMQSMVQEPEAAAFTSTVQTKSDCDIAYNMCMSKPGHAGCQKAHNQCLSPAPIEQSSCVTDYKACMLKPGHIGCQKQLTECQSTLK